MPSRAAVVALGRDRTPTAPTGERSSPTCLEGFGLLDRNNRFAGQEHARPTRWNERRAPGALARSRPRRSRAGRQAEVSRNSVSKRGISMKSDPVRSSQYSGK